MARGVRSSSWFRLVPGFAGFDGFATFGADIGFKLMKQVPALTAELCGADLDLKLAQSAMPCTI